MVTVKEGRLNAKVRERIKEIVINHRFKAEYDQLVTDRAAWAQSVYSDAYTKPNNKGLQELPKGWVPEKQFGRYVFAGEFYYVVWSGGWAAHWNQENPFKRWFSEPESVFKRILAKDLDTTIEQYDGAQPLAITFAALRGRESDLKASITKTDAIVTSQLGGVNTVTQLIAQWPEVEPFLDDLGFDPKSRQVPVINRTELNELLNLPRVDEAPAELPTEGIEP